MGDRDASAAGVWLGASYALGLAVVGQVTRVRYRLVRRDCAACAERRAAP